MGQSPAELGGCAVPRCGEQKLFKNWITMHPDCQTCHLHYEREPGFFLGSIYMNYGLTAVLVTIGYFAALFQRNRLAAGGAVDRRRLLARVSAVVLSLRAACGSVSINTGIRRFGRRRNTRVKKSRGSATRCDDVAQRPAGSVEFVGADRSFAALASRAFASFWRRCSRFTAL